jgi:hypothetical protein
MSINRITSYTQDDEKVALSPQLPAGFAVCQLGQAVQNPLALQLIAQQQAFEQALIAAKEEALRIVLGRLRTSVN